jgi:hypothetical protein
LGICFLKEMRDFVQAEVETNVNHKEEQGKGAIPGVTKYFAALRHAQGAYLIAR